MYYRINAHKLGDDCPDSYSRRGVEASRDAAHVILASLANDAHAHRERGGVPNTEHAAVLDDLRAQIGRALGQS